MPVWGGKGRGAGGIFFDKSDSAKQQDKVKGDPRPAEREADSVQLNR